MAAVRSRQLGDLDIDAKRVLLELARLATVDIRDFYAADGSVKPPSDWTPAMGASVAQVETLIKNAEAGDGHTDRVLKFRLWDKPAMLNTLAKHLGLMVERMQVSGKLIVEWAPES